MQCALMKGEPDLIEVARRAEQVARQSVRADVATLYIVNEPQRELASITAQPGFNGTERFPIKDSLLAHTVLHGDPWKNVRFGGIAGMSRHPIAA